MFSNDEEACIEACIQNASTGQPLEEYQVETFTEAEEGMGGSTECFVEVIDEPSVITLQNYSDAGTMEDYCITLIVDGREIERIPWLYIMGAKVLDQVLESDGMYRSELRFAPLATTGAKQDTNLTSEQLAKFGTIELVLEKGTYSFIATEPGRYIERYGELVGGTVYEKDKKQSTQDDVVQRCLIKAETAGEVFYRFVFKYRSHITLVKQGILAPDPIEASSIPSASISRSSRCCPSCGPSSTSTRSRSRTTIGSEAGTYDNPIELEE